MGRIDKFLASTLYQARDTTVMMWRGKDVVYNILGYLVFAVPIEMPFIAYREPRGGTTPPDPP